MEEIVSGKVICSTGSFGLCGDEEDSIITLHSFDLDGTNEQILLEDIHSFFIYNNQIYWLDVEYTVQDDNEYWEYEYLYVNYRWRTCDLNGENKTDVTDWLYGELYEINTAKEYVIEHYIENQD